MADKETKDSSPLKAIRYTSIAILVIVFTVTLALNFKFFPLELLVSGLPQVMIVVFGLYIFLITVYLKLVTKEGLSTLRQKIGTTEVGMGIAGVVLFSYIIVFSFNIIKPLSLTDKSNDSFKIATFNKLYSNEDLLSGVNYFISQAPDVAGFQEILPEELEVFRKGLGVEYSYSTDCDCSAKTTEVALLSKYPILDASTIYQYKNGAIIRAEIISDQFSKVVVYVGHITPPFSPTWYDRRSEAYSALERSLSRETDPTFVVGDFNTTIFSPVLHEFIDNTVDTLQYAATENYPNCSWYGLKGLFCMRIDQIFIPKKTSLRDFQIGPFVGSDHRPVMAEVIFN